MNYLQAVRLFGRDTRLFLAAVAIVGFNYFGVYAVLFNLYLLRLGYGPEFIGLINGLGLLTFAVCSLPTGLAGQHWGVRRAMAVGAVCLALGGWLIPLAEAVPEPLRSVWLVAAFVVAWLGGSFFVVDSAPYLMGVTGDQERGHAFAVQSALSPLSGFTGNLVAGFLSGMFAAALGVPLTHPAPYRHPLWICAVLYTAVVFLILAMQEPKTELETNRGAAAGPARTAAVAGAAPVLIIATMGLYMFLRLASEGAARPFFNVYLDAALMAPTALIGGLIATGQLVAVPAALATPLVRAAWGRERSILWGTAGIALCMLPLAFIPHWAAAGFGYMGVIFMSWATTPLLTVYQQELVPSRWRPAMSGASNTASGLSQAAMAFGGGYVVAAFGYASLFLIGAVFTLLGALLFWSYFRLPRRLPAFGS